MERDTYFRKLKLQLVVYYIIERVLEANGY